MHAMQKLSRSKQRKALGEVLQPTAGLCFLPTILFFLTRCGQKYVVKTRGIEKNIDISCRNPRRNQRLCEYSQQITTEFDQYSPAPKDQEKLFSDLFGSV